MGVFAVAVGAAVVAARDVRRPSSDAPQTAPPSLDAELSSCAAVLAGPVCELPPDAALRAWVPGGRAEVTFHPAVETTVLRELDEGTLFRVVVPPGTTELEIRAPGGLRVTRRLAPSSAPAWHARAKAARDGGDAEAALTLAREHATSTSPVDRAFALGLEARIALARGQVSDALSRLRESSRLHRERGRVSDAADDAFALAFALNQRSHRYGEARAVLDEVRELLAIYPDGGAREAYYRGTLSMETGDARDALARLTDARARAQRLGLDVLERHATNAHALTLAQLGRLDDAAAQLHALAREAEAAENATPCERAEIAINLGYVSLLHSEQTGRPPPVDAANERAIDERCRDTYLRTAARGNHALGALLRGETAEARAALARARSHGDEARHAEVLFWHDLDGRIALAEDAPRRALAAFEEEERVARSTLAEGAAWRAAVGAGEALERLGRTREALERYRVAEVRLSTDSFLVPLGEGRGLFLGDRAKSARLAIDLLVRLGRSDEALAVARTSRARVVTGLARAARLEGFSPDARARWEAALGAYRTERAALEAEAKDDWKLAASEAAPRRRARQAREERLRGALDAAIAAVSADHDAAPLEPLPSDALTLALHPARDRWIGFVADGARVTSFVMARPPTEGEAASVVFGPMRDALAGARRLRVLAYGELRQLDFHALLVDGAPLVEKVAVEYPLDLPRRPKPAPRDAARSTALVIADPTLDLESARLEGRHVARALGGRGTWDVTVLEGSRATAEAVRDELPRAELLHYAGHGVFAGREGWKSALPLAAGGELTIGDLLTAPGAPAQVILSGCETARTDRQTPTESLGLAQAFVLAGAELVVAPVRPVADALAARMSEAFSGALSEEGVSPSAALRAAQLRLRREAPSLDWSAFRVVCE